VKKEYKIIAGVFGGFALLSVLAIAAIFGLLISISDSQPENDSFNHKVEYSAEFTVNGTLNDTVMYLPYPEDKEFRNTVQMNRSNVSIHNEWNTNLSVVNTSRGEMLKAEIGYFRPQTFEERFQEEVNESQLPDGIEREEIIDDKDSEELSEYNSYDLIISVDYNNTLDTKNGLSTEPHIPSNRSSRTDCGPRFSCEVATTEAFLSYKASNETYMDMDIELNGRNSWLNWGQSSNRYSQRFYNSYYDDRNIIGTQNNWITLTGSEEEGDGNYREE